MKEIQSSKNPLIKETKKLQQKKYRQQSQTYLLEGFHLIQEAHAADVVLKDVFISQRGVNEWSDWIEENLSEYYLVSDEVLKHLASQPAPQGMIAVAEMPQEKEIDFSGAWLLLDNVQDPGNVGTMIRTADAAGFSGVILGQGSADLYNPKTLRSTQGSLYHLTISNADLTKIIPQFQQQGSLVLGTALDKNAKEYLTVEKTENVALVMGNEGQGMSSAVLALTDQNLYIPIKGQAESLNVAIAAGVLMFHLLK
ncbi:RNA methyltransferase [Enterococcus dongliensis]|uniref:RNA methyltransferase n=1 Tax=Enterococcus dongliensis TaxID=2559925 RepID=A0AAP5NMU5_9ENTE|nr:RNA methyltransferase [Enterococcus dongliensis]MDT2596328.1 RNA methyltransferase [Enterococcus dongliensis]MDT2604370.1 RNA methyltransferase [Enterococcus dongliensis]MDT2635237.1 RNA methyltransferase [Enterococcus dongliensis]MDT2637481.1 RNA methyltransferase [Enterococcus dongliensis]MDT2643252.1 RNA methyltransferase [Enterococcus dongliensis]